MCRMILVSLTVRWMQNQAGNSADHKAEVPRIFQININEKKNQQNKTKHFGDDMKVKEVKKGSRVLLWAHWRGRWGSWV